LSLLGPLSEALAKAGLRAVPRLEGRTIKIEITEAELQEALTRDIQPGLRNAIRVRLLEGKMVIEVNII